MCVNAITYTYFSRTAWTSIPEESHLQEGANESKHTQSHINASLEINFIVALRHQLLVNEKLPTVCHEAILQLICIFHL